MGSLLRISFQGYKDDSDHAASPVILDRGIEKVRSE